MRKTALVLLGMSILLAAIYFTFHWGSEPVAGHEGDTPNEYKPAIMVDSQIYWLSPSGSVNSIPDNSRAIGQIQTISSPTEPPAENWEAIGFSEDFLGADIYRSEEEMHVIYFHNQELELYIPFAIIEE